MIIMEDIGVDGFRTADRILGLDMRHIELVVEKLAIYHAASAYHFEQVCGGERQECDWLCNDCLIYLCLFVERGIQ